MTRVISRRSLRKSRSSPTTRPADVIVSVEILSIEVLHARMRDEAGSEDGVSYATIMQFFDHLPKKVRNFIHHHKNGPYLFDALALEFIHTGEVNYGLILDYL